MSTTHIIQISTNAPAIAKKESQLTAGDSFVGCAFWPLNVLSKSMDASDEGFSEDAEARVVSLAIRSRCEYEHAHALSYLTYLDVADWLERSSS